MNFMNTRVEEIYISEFERAVIVFEENTTLVSIDTYRDLKNLSMIKVSNSITIDPITVKYIVIKGDRACEISSHALKIEYVILEYHNSNTLISIRIILRPNIKELGIRDIVAMRDKAISLLMKHLGHRNN